MTITELIEREFKEKRIRITNSHGLISEGVYNGCIIETNPLGAEINHIIRVSGTILDLVEDSNLQATIEILEES